MEPSLNFFAVINTLGVVQCILMALALFSIDNDNRTANRFLGCFLIVLAVFIIDLVIIDTGYHQIFPHLWGVTYPIDYLITPPLFLYVKALTAPKFEFTRKHLWHFIPFILVFLLESEKFFLPITLKQAGYREILAGTVSSNFYYYLTITSNLYVVTYLYICYRIVKNALRQKKHTLSARIVQNIRWFKNLLLTLFSIAILSTILDVLPSLSMIDDYLTPFFLTVVVYGMGFMGIRQSEIFTTSEFSSDSKKYQKSVLTDEMANKILKKLAHLMEVERTFADSTLSLPKLAGMLRISTHHLSQVLNERLNRTFFNYINEHRVEFAKQKLLAPDSQKYTMLELAYEVGFNSLSAFNTAFKKHTGMSPTAYKKANLS